MPTTPYSWTLISPPSASGGVSGSTALGGTSAGAPELPCPVEPFTQQDFLDLFGRLLADHYLAPLISPGPGYEVLQAYAAVGARLSLGVERFGCGAFILSSSGGSFATGSVELYRASPSAEGIALTVKEGTVVKSSRAGRRYRTTADVLFGPADLGPFTVGIRSQFQGYEFNEPGVVVTADGTALPGEIDTIDVLFQSAPSQPLANAGTATATFNAPSGGLQLVAGLTGGSFSPESVGRYVTFTGALNAANNGSRAIVEYQSSSSVRVRNALGVSEVGTAGVGWQEFSAVTDIADTTILVRQPSATGGGRDAALDAHGKDRGIPRGVLETDTSYRGRIRALPDNISPNAIDRTLQQLLFPYGQSYQFVETWDVAYQTCWDAPALSIPGSGYDSNLFVYDDPRPPTPFRGRWMDLNEMRGAFVVVVPVLSPIRDTGLVYDDTAGSPVALTGPLGSRAVSSYDVPSTLGFGYVQGAWDGFDQVANTTYKTIYDTMQAAKAAGTAAAVELKGQ
jgi:hypothetical protein